jgi:hypothetical protein
MAAQGRFLPIAGAAELPAALERICQSIWHQFEISYRTSEPVTPAVELRLQVHSAAGMAEGVCTAAPPAA